MERKFMSLEEAAPILIKNKEFKECSARFFDCLRAIRLRLEEQDRAEQEAQQNKMPKAA